MNEISPINFFKYYQTKNQFKIIDLREFNEFEKYHIKNTINIPFSLIMEKHYLFLNKHNTYFLICNNGEKSKFASEYLNSLGYHVIYIIGGLKNWPGAFVNELEKQYWISVLFFLMQI